MTEIRIRKKDPGSIAALEQQGMHPLLAELFAARGIKPQQAEQVVSGGLAKLLPPAGMKGIDDAAMILAGRHHLA